MSTEPSSLPYFAYGSNLLLARLRQDDRCPGAERLGVGTAHGWRLSFAKRSNVDGSGKCTIHRCDDPDADEVVHGVLYRIDPDDRAALDRVEGVGFGYEVAELDVETADGTVRAFAYVAQPEWTAEELIPHGWYRDLVLEGALENQFPDDVVKQLRETRTSEDPDRERSARERRVLERRLRQADLAGGEVHGDDNGESELG